MKHRSLVPLAWLFAAASVASAQEVRTKLREGHLSKLSIGYQPMDWSFEERDGREVRLLKEVRLWEASVVVMPMNPEAAVTAVKGSGGAFAVDDAIASEAALLALAHEESAMRGRRS